jgi:tRNA(Ile)-lysidine synthase TilS/MesJ
MSVAYIKNINHRIDFSQYDKIVVWFSGGKDSVDCVLRLFELGIKSQNIELHHHLIDGKGDMFMDWQCTEDYCRKFAEAFGLEIFFSWKVGGFEGEMLRDNSFTGAKAVPGIDGEIITIPASTNEKYKNTRLKYPQQSGDFPLVFAHLT